jgi:hypothetical protein
VAIVAWLVVWNGGGVNRAAAFCQITLEIFLLLKVVLHQVADVFCLGLLLLFGLPT